MDKTYSHLDHEQKLYQMWESSGAFKPEINPDGAPYSIIMPPPNANGELHLGHATFIAVSDALIRYHRMTGKSTLWLPGVDHAGILSQVTFEKKLKTEENKTRHDLGRTEFHRRLYEFCMQCKSLMERQLKALGSSCDWTREKFTLDPEVSKLVLETFIHMHHEGLVYRGYRIVNWCPRCRSTLSELELEHKEQTDPLYYVKYPIVQMAKSQKLTANSYITVATTRVEPIWVDTHLAVNPKDKKHKHLIGTKVLNPLTQAEMEIIGDEFVDPEFGTSIVKLTPAHDPADYEVATKHNLPIISAIDFDGKLLPGAGKYAGMKTKVAREAIATELQAKSLIEKIDTQYQHTVSTCERCGTVIEPLVSRQWFVKIASLAEPAIKAVEQGKTKILPEKYQSMYFNWMRNIRDWPISRQLWWGHQLPVWYAKSNQKTPEQLKEFELLTIGDTRARTDVLENPILSIEKPKGKDIYIQDPDTLDTWFSSGQWPINTLKTSRLNDFSKYYPTSVMNTAYEILFLWVARMIMFGLYLTDEVPFTTVLINGVLRDEKGQKMSKSKGNGVNPNDAISKYGADAVRMALLAGRDPGNDLLISKQQMEDRIRGYRNFSNKLWNIGRFITQSFEGLDPQTIPWYKPELKGQQPEDQQIVEKLNNLIQQTTDDLENYRLGQAAENLYHFVWHELADIYLEQIKTRTRDKDTMALCVLRKTYLMSIKMLHPFIPFVTESLWQQLKTPLGLSEDQLITSKWPTPYLKKPNSLLS